MTIGVSKFKKLEQYFRDKFEDFIRLFDENSERPAAQTQQKSTQVSLLQPSPPPPPTGYKTLFAQEFLPNCAMDCCNGVQRINYYQW